MIDLHFHSTYSDGKLSVPELAELIKARGLKYCALTDHDTVAGVIELQKCLEGTDIKVIPGVELTALDGDNEIHVLAYDFDVEVVEKILEERNNDIRRRQKNEEMQKAINLFKQEGIKISDSLIPVAKQPVGRTLAVDICQHEVNQDLFLKRHGKILTPDEIYFEYQAIGKSCAVKRSGVSVEWLIENFKNKVGNLILAHPFVQISIATRALTENNILSLLDRGLNGVEIYHDKTSPNQIEWLNKLIEQRKLPYTGGSDFHGNQNDLALGLYGLNLEIPNFELKKLQF